MNIADRTLVSSYAEALFGAAKNKGALEEVATQAEQLHQLVEENQDLRTFMNAPNISREDKEKFFASALSGRFNELIVNFLRLLVRRGRLILLGPIFEEFHNQYLADKGFAEGKITTAVELSDTEKAGVQAVLNAFTGKTLQLKYRIDPKVIGGLTFQSGDLLIGNTLSAGLTNLRQSLRKARVY